MIEPGSDHHADVVIVDCGGRGSGTEAINEYTEVKTVWMDTGSTIADPFNPRA